MESIWPISKIRETLPQRYPFLFIDKVIEIDQAAGRVVCLKNLTQNEHFFVGHFPDNPIMPGVIMIEVMAQASIIGFAALKPEVAAKKPTYFLGKVEVKFSKPVRPGDQLFLEVQKEKMIATAGIVSASAKVDGQVVAQARITFGVKVYE